MISAEDLKRLQELGVNVNNERVHHLVMSGYHYDFDNKRWHHPDKAYSTDTRTAQEIEAEFKTQPPPEARHRDRSYRPAFHDNQEIREHPRSDTPAIPRSAELQKKIASRYANDWDRLSQRVEMIRRYNMGEDLEGWVVRRKPGGGNSLDDYEVWSPEEVLQMRNHKKQQAERAEARQQLQQQQVTRKFGESARMVEFAKMLKGMPKEQFLDIMQHFGFIPDGGEGTSNVQV